MNYEKLQERISRKKRYLEGEGFRFEDATKEVAKRIFDTVFITENQKDKDLSEFNRSQVIDLLKGINSKSKNYLRLVTKICFEYTNWCKIEGAIDKTNVNYYDWAIVKDIIDDLVPIEMIADKYFKEDYIEDIVINKVKDPVNKFLVYAPFKGVCGASNDDLKYLEYKDIDEKEKTVKLKSGKIIMVDDLFIKLAKAANEATEYMPEGTSYDSSEDLEGKKKIRNKNAFKYGSSCYILKSAGTIETDYKEVTQSFITNRFIFIQKQVGNKFIIPSNLYKNGMINFIKNKFDEQGVSLQDAFFEKINRQKYKYGEQLKSYIEAFGSNLNERQLRQEIKDIISLYE